MNWNEQFSKEMKPSIPQIDIFIDNPLFSDLCAHLESAYGVTPTVEHSICSGAPGWNMKYKKSGRALCTLYPAEGFFTCMVSIGTKEAMEAELLLSNCTDTVRALYWQCKPFNGGRWLMIDVKSPEILADVKALIGTRVRIKKADHPGDDLASLVKGLEGRDQNAAYACFLTLQEESRKSDEIYPYFDRFAALLDSGSAYARTRGLLLIAANARWDKAGKFERIADAYLEHLEDEKPTVVRQLIAALPELAQGKPELAQAIRQRLQTIDPAKYRDSMAPLIRKDIDETLPKI